MIRGAVREAGDRAKVAVYSRERDVDPVGACVGMDDRMLESCGCTHNDTEGVINLPLTAREIQAVVFFKTGTNGDVRVSMVKVINIDPSGKIRLSRKALLQPPAAEEAQGRKG